MNFTKVYRPYPFYRWSHWSQSIRPSLLYLFTIKYIFFWYDKKISEHAQTFILSVLCIFDVLFIELYIWVYAIRLGKETAPILMLKRSDNPFWRYSRNYTVSGASMCCTTSYPYFFIFWTLITSWCRLFTVVIHGTVIGRYVYLTIYIIREDDGYNIYTLKIEALMILLMSSHIVLGPIPQDTP